MVPGEWDDRPRKGFRVSYHGKIAFELCSSCAGAARWNYGTEMTWLEIIMQFMNRIMYLPTKFNDTLHGLGT